jgi:hypothetical protein
VPPPRRIAAPGVLALNIRHAIRAHLSTKIDFGVAISCAFLSFISYSMRVQGVDAVLLSMRMHR